MRQLPNEALASGQGERLTSLRGPLYKLNLFLVQMTAMSDWYIVLTRHMSTTPTGKVTGPTGPPTCGG